MVLTAAMIATATGGRVTAGPADRVFAGFSIDSRTVQPGDLFFAIVAARDGHAFVADALARGAAGAVVESGATGAGGAIDATGAVRFAGATGAAGAAGAVIIEVADTTAALQALGRHVRRGSGATVVAITGSAGKTTTKEAIAALLADRYRVVRNRGNLNNHLGLPLSLLELRHGADVAVMELGMNHAGEIRLLVGLAEPEIRVWTNVGDAHLGYFASPAAIADAKAEILEQATPADVLVVNADDPLIMGRIGGFPGRVITFGVGAEADVRAEAVADRGLDGSSLRLRIGGQRADADVPLLGRGNLYNVLAAAAVASELGVSTAEIAERCRSLRPAPHRGAVVRLARGVTVVDDSYNSSPAALRRALEILAADRSGRRKAAVLGEMLELGDHATRLHDDCGLAAAAAGLDRLITVGGDPARTMAEAAVRGGMPPSAVAWTAGSEAASALIVPWLSAGDLVLVKGSRGIRTDAVVDRITAEFS